MDSSAHQSVDSSVQQSAQPSVGASAHPSVGSHPRLTADTATRLHTSRKAPKGQQHLDVGVNSRSTTDVSPRTSTYIQWLGNIPDGWEVVKMKNLFEIRSQKGFPNEPILCATQSKGVIPQSMYENRVVTVNKDFDKLKLVRVGDFVISLRSFQGGIEYAYYQGIISAAYTILIINHKENTEYFKYLFKSNIFIDLLKTCVIGIREGQNINYPMLREKYLPLPPLSVQRRISSYLDEKTELINRLIETRTAQIEKLKQYRAAVVSSAVTKGLNPNRKMKNSNIQWIGDIPEDWEVKRIKDVAFLQSGDNLTSADIESEGLYPVYGGNGLRGYYDKYNVEGFHVLIGRQGALCGNINYGEGKFWATDHAVVCYQNERIDTKWFGQLLTAMNLNQYSTASAQPGLSVDKIKMLQIPLPSLSEQLEIASYLDAKVSEINKLIKVYEDEIEKMKNYKNSLVSAVVTGQIAV